MYSDEYLEYWALVFHTDPRLPLAGLSYETFLRDPNGFLTVVADEIQFQALLKQQDLIARQVAEEDEYALQEAMLPADAKRQGDRFISQTRHHSWADSRHAHRNLRPQ